VSVKIANIVCEIQSSLDFTTLDLSCITETDRSLSNILESFARNHCSLAARVYLLEHPVGVSGVSGVTGTAAPFGTNLSCLPTLLSRPVPSTGLTNNEIIQWIVDGVCEVSKNLSDAIVDLTILINNRSGSGSSSIPIVASNCLFGTPIPIDQAWIYLDEVFCDYIEQLGTISDIEAARVQESDCITNINTVLGTSLVASTNQAEAIKNLWEVVCNLTSQIDSMTAIVNNCCSFNCKDFEITMTTYGYDSAANTLDIRLLFNGSLTLPTSVYDFTNDPTNTITLTDHTGFSLSPFLDITDDSTYTDISLTGLDLSQDITITATIGFTVVEINGDEREFSCSKCLQTIFRSNIGCAFCHLIIGGTDLDVRMTYSVNGVSQTITITSAGTYVIPANSVIESILVISGSMFTIASESCPSLEFPEYTTLSCYAFVIDGDFFNGAPDAPTDGSEFFYYIDGYMIDGVEYLYNTNIRCDIAQERDYPAMTSGDSETCTETFDTSPLTMFNVSYNYLTDIPTNPYITEFNRVCRFASLNTSTEPDTYDTKYVSLLVEAVSGKTIFLKMTAKETTNDTDSTLIPNPEVYLKGVEITSGDCDCCNVHNGT